MPENRSSRTGCIVGLVVFAVVLAFFFVVALFGLYFGKQALDEFAGDAPVGLPPVALTEEEHQAVLERVRAFGEALDAGAVVEPFVLTEDEVNALIHYSEFLDELGQYARLELHDDLVTATVSYPLGRFTRFLSGRYVNGTGQFDVFLRKGVFYIVPLSFDFNDERLPDEFANAMRRQNVVSYVEDDDASEALRDLVDRIETQIGRIEIREGEIVLTPKTAILFENFLRYI